MLLSHLPNELPLAQPIPLNLGWWGDASTSFGIGIVVGPFWAAWSWAPGFVIGPKKDFDIGWAEAVAVELGLRLLLHQDMLRGSPQSSPKLLVRSDNAGVVTVVNKGRSRLRNTNAVLREIYLLLADHRICLTAEHIPSRLNVTDALSRGDVAGFLAGFPSATTQIRFSLPPHLASKLVSM
ncbi:hypothetical protein A0H81_01329 [Grifola frondosa]|uniref:RNase H type-1 domain-containing protein n=1 Tax=Grifola frondosa TaxID=5627 RepID=A0A1C7MS94_GRIFR|nr:hypothetical protein A0H81_01329 [Grifola frondosa]